MKKTILLSLMLMPLCLMAQHPLSAKDMYWTNGDIFFFFPEQAARPGLYAGLGGTLHEGGIIFGLAGKGRKYKLVEADNGEKPGSELYSRGQTLFYNKENVTAELKTIMGKRYLLFYDGNSLLDVYHEESETGNDITKLETGLIRKIFLAGEYIDPKGDLVTFDGNSQRVHGLRNGWENYTIEKIFDVVPSNIISIDKETSFSVFHEDDGLLLKKMEHCGQDPTDWNENGAFIRLYHVLPNNMRGTAGKTSRFDFASSSVLYSSVLGSFTKSELRLMRNEIFARHGYSFHAEDLRQYFGQCPWYSPLGDNDAALAGLTETEKINIQLIKHFEEMPLP